MYSQFLQGIVAWTGSLKSATKEARLAYALKKLQSRHSWVGHFVHDSIASVLTAYRDEKTVATREEILLKIRTRFWNEIKRSRATAKKLKDQRALPTSSEFLFQEHFYEIWPTWSHELPEWRRMWQIVEVSLTNFYTEFLPLIQSLPKDALIEIDRVGGFDRTSNWDVKHRIEGIEKLIRIYVRPDLIFRLTITTAGTTQTKVIIVDWKTGKREAIRTEKYMLQLALYFLMTRAHLNVPPEDIEAWLVYLPDAAWSLEERTEKLLGSNVKIAEAETELNDAIKSWRKRFSNPDRSETTPEQWPAIDNPDICKHCQMRQACKFAPRELLRQDLLVQEVQSIFGRAPLPVVTPKRETRTKTGQLPF